MPFTQEHSSQHPVFDFLWDISGTELKNCKKMLQCNTLSKFYVQMKNVEYTFNVTQDPASTIDSDNFY